MIAIGKSSAGLSHALQEKLEPLGAKSSHDLMNCPETEKGVDSVRKLESENARLTEALRVKEEECKRLGKAFRSRGCEWLDIAKHSAQITCKGSPTGYATRAES